MKKRNEWIEMVNMGFKKIENVITSPAVVLLFFILAGCYILYVATSNIRDEKRQDNETECLTQGGAWKIDHYEQVWDSDNTVRVIPVYTCVKERR